MNSVLHFDFALTIRLQIVAEQILNGTITRVYDLKTPITEALDALVWRHWIPCESDKSVEERITTILNMTVAWNNHKELLVCHKELSTVRM